MLQERESKKFTLGLEVRRYLGSSGDVGPLAEEDVHGAGMTLLSSEMKCRQTVLPAENNHKPQPSR